MKKAVLLFVFCLIAQDLVLGQYQKKISLAILPFEFTSAAQCGSDYSWMTNGVPDQMRTAFRHYRNRIRLLERNRLNDLIQEQQLSQAGFVSEDQMIEVGKFFSADFSIAGSIVCTDKNHLLMTVKIIDIETSEYCSVNYVLDVAKDQFCIGDSLVEKVYPELLRLQQERRFAREVEVVQKIPPATSTQPLSVQKSEITDKSNIQLISAFSKAATSHFYNAVNLMHQYNWQGAESELLRCIELDSSFARAYANLGTVYLNQGKFAEARLALNKCLQIFPNSELAYQNLGLLEANRGDFYSALTYFKKALEISPDNLEIMIRIGKVYLKTKNLQQAEKIFNDVLWNDSSYVEADFYLGLISAMQGDFKTAEQLWKKVIETKEPYFQEIKHLAQMRLGRLYESQYQDIQKSISFYEQALYQWKGKIDDFEVKKLFLPLSGLYMKTQQWPKAIDLLQQVINFDDKNLEARYALATALFNSDQKDRALIELQIITMTAPPGKLRDKASKLLKKIRGY